MRLRRILMTVDAVGGVWQYACELSAALRPLGVETTLALLGPKPDDAQRRDVPESVRLIATDLDLDWLAPDAAAVERAGSVIATMAHDLGVDLVHLNQPALAASARFHVPVVVTIHSCVATWWQAAGVGEAPSSFAWQTELVARGLRRCDAVVAPSSAFAEAVQRTYALQATPRVVPNGREAPPDADGAALDGIFTAGRLWDKAKNLELLDRVAARLTEPFRAAGAVHGPHGGRVVLHHIEALGTLDAASLAAHLARRPVFVSAALYEPFGLAVLEAASAGCALVLADIPTFREMWDGAALFVPARDENGFVAAIHALLRDPKSRAHYGASAKARAARFTPGRMASATHVTYARALAARELRIAAA